MNLFCRLLGHTWTHRAEDPKIRWTTNPKTLNELDLCAEGEPVFYELCVRCKARRPVQPRERRSDPARSA